MFGGLQNTSNSGTPIPLIYGMHRVAGQLNKWLLRYS